MNIGINLFGPAKKLYQDFNGTLNRLKAIGFSSAEICVIFGDPSQHRREIPPEFLEKMQAMSGGIWQAAGAGPKIAAFRDQGFTVRSAHIMTDTSSAQNFLAMLPEIKAFGAEQGLKYFVISLMKPLIEMTPFIPVLNRFVDELGAVGIQLAYHNHELECLPDQGTTALDAILAGCPGLMLELDVGWAQFAGTSPLAWISTYRDRITMLHFKDVRADASPETRETCFTAIGAGSIPLKAIMAATAQIMLDEHGLIIDQDDSPGDILDDLTVGFDNMQAAVS